ncbi:MAG: DNA gyrase modulator, partial [Candidatus Zixiibacteriota bacterium]
MDDKNFAEMALAQCRKLGCSYADIRIESIRDQNISISKGTIDPIEQTTSRGFGIRVIKDGAWGFAASDNFEEKNIKVKVELAAEIAAASAKVNQEPVELAKLKAQSGDYQSPCRIDPFTVPLDQKISFLQ